MRQESESLKQLCVETDEPLPLFILWNTKKRHCVAPVAMRLFYTISLWSFFFLSLGCPKEGISGSSLVLHLYAYSIPSRHISHWSDGIQTSNKALLYFNFKQLLPFFRQSNFKNWTKWNQE